LQLYHTCTTQKPITLQSPSVGISSHLCLNRTPLHLLPAIPLPLLIQELALLVRTQSSELRITLFALELVRGRLALLCLFLLVYLADLGDLLLARLLDAAEGFGAEVRGRGEVVGEAQEVLEERERRGVVGLELHGEIDALLGLGLVEAGQVSWRSVGLEEVCGLTSLAGRWAGRSR
jgi:hypothetical protein